ncbi:hypothetical protein HDV05_002451 [Chytridiales sp. JEL 0842]|nr:hypothetical protein HDV05_002451 [Chytridiales sp. JEL 0842]
MKLPSLLSLLSLLALAQAAPNNSQFRRDSSSEHGPSNNNEDAIPYMALVEFPSFIGPGCEGAKDRLVNHLKGKGVNFKTRVLINTKLFCGISFETDADKNALALVADLKGTTTNVIHSRAAPKPLARAEAAQRGSGELFHSLTGVNEAREKLGLTGKGIRVAVIDTGVYYLHPALGSGFGKGFKVGYGYDLVGDAYSWMNNAIVPDNDPIDNCSESSHGTHVAGIIAGNTTGVAAAGFVSPVPFTGSAPEVTIGAYRIFGCAADGTGSDVISAAIYRAAEDKSDVINLSVGGGPDYPESADCIAANRVARAGHIVVASNGNDGAVGFFAGGNPGGAAGAIGVGSFDNLAAPQSVLTVGGVKYPYGVGANGRFAFPQTLNVLIFSPNADEQDLQTDGCFAIPAGPQYAGKTLMFRWGSGNAFRAGAAACLIYNTNNDLFGIAGSLDIPSALTSYDAGKAILANPAATVVITAEQANFNVSTGGFVSGFSSMGLNNDLHIKPDIGGIGGQVLSTISPFAANSAGSLNAYGVYSGTSMSSPYTAGCIALLLQSRGKMNAETVRTYLLNSAVPRKLHNSPLLDSVAKQGAGLVNIFNAVTSRTLVRPPLFSLNDTVNMKTSYQLTITNQYPTTARYTLRHTGAAMGNPFIESDDTLIPADWISYTADYATVQFGENPFAAGTTSYTITLKPNESKTVFVRFREPVTANPKLFPVYSGYINITNNVDFKYQTVPYAGMVGDWSAAPIWSRNSPNLYGVSSGTYANDEFGALKAGANINPSSGRGLVFLSIISTSARVGGIEVIYTGNDTSTIRTLRQMGLWNKRNQGIIVSHFTPNDPYPYINWGTLLRSAPFEAQGVAGPYLTYWSGEVMSLNDAETNPYGAPIRKLPAGQYKIRMLGLKHFRRPRFFGDNNFDVIESPSFNLVYGRPT